MSAALPASDVEDVLQETFLAAWKGAQSYWPEAKAGGWPRGIARRQAGDPPRRRGPVAASLSDLPQPGTASPAGSPCPDDPAHAVTAASQIASAVEVWQLMYVEDRPVAEVAWLRPPHRAGHATIVLKSPGFLPLRAILERRF